MVFSSLNTVPSAELRMPVDTYKQVELFCEMDISQFMLCVSYNLILLLLCAVHAFLTRTLPDNFNESGYLFVTVCITSFLWLVFLPTYFTMFYAYHQAALLAFCLFLNCACALLCLFLPKVYAVYFLNENDMAIMTGGSNKRTATQSQVGPLERGISFTT